MLSALIALSFLTSQKPFDFHGFGPYNGSVPKPESILGYGPAEKHTTHVDQGRVILAIAGAAKDRVRVFDYGKSTEGRPLRILAISSPSNISKLEQIRKDNETIANGQATAELIRKTPSIVWINETIHGNEPASFESGMWLIYNLAASRNSKITDMLDDAVVIVNPVFNPDGHERFVVWYNSISAGSGERGAYEHSEPSVIGGRTNHYRFDMNRDHLAVSQDETRQELAMLMHWNPHVYVDQHGQVDTYFFPPNPMSVNANVDRARLNKWTDIFGRATAAEFDKQGWLYFVKDTYDFFAPVYTDTWAALSGAIGMTHETEGSKVLRVDREDGSVWTLRDAAAKHFTSALAVISSSASRRQDLVTSFADFKKRVASGAFAGSFQRVVLTGHPRALERLAAQLSRSGIKSQFASSFKLPKSHDYWSGKVADVDVPAGSLVVDMNQPQGALAKSFFEPEVDFEQEFIKEQIKRREKAKGDEQYPAHPGSEFYDLTGWALPYAHNLQAWWSSERPSFPSVGLPAPVSSKGGAIGWALPYEDVDDILAVADLLSKGVRVQLAPDEMKLVGSKWGRATFLILKSRNDEDVAQKLDKVERDRRVTFKPLDTAYPESGRFGPGSENVVSVKKPKIGIVFGDRAWTSSFGAVWYLMDRWFKLPFVPLTYSATGGDMTDYTCLVFPAGQYGTPSEKLKEWVRAGGCLVVLGSPGWAIGDGKFAQLETVKLGGKDPGYVPGSMFRALLDPRSFLSYGHAHPSPVPGGGAGGGGSDDPPPIPFAVYVEGDTFYKALKTGGAAVKFSTDEKAKKLLSGWAWPDDTEKALVGTAWLHDQPYGQGHVILFTQDPSDRAQWPGLYKLLLNAILLGPSF